MIRALALALTAGVIHVSAHGKIGPLQIDRSTRADVVAFMGAPDAETHMYGYFQKRDPLDALGYHCRRSYGVAAFKLGRTRCLDVFWIDARTGKLGNAVLTDRRFVGPFGIRVGTRSATVERALHQRLAGGCTLALHDAALTFTFAGGTNTSHVIGARVDELVLDGHQDTGLFECV